VYPIVDSGVTITYTTVVHGERKDGECATFVNSDVHLCSVERGVIGTAVYSPITALLLY